MLPTWSANSPLHVLRSRIFVEMSAPTATSRDVGVLQCSVPRHGVCEDRIDPLYCHDWIVSIPRDLFLLVTFEGSVRQSLGSARGVRRLSEQRRPQSEAGSTLRNMGQPRTRQGLKMVNYEKLVPQIMRSTE